MKGVTVSHVASRTVLLLLASLSFATAHASIPSSSNSTCPTSVIVSQDSASCFEVVVRDAASNPIAHSLVEVNFAACAVAYCPSETYSGTVVSEFTDAAGVARFAICVAPPASCNVEIFADGVLLCAPPVMLAAPIVPLFLETPPPASSTYDVFAPDRVTSGGTIPVFVQRSRPATPLSGVTVILKTLQWAEVARAVTDENGFALLPAPTVMNGASFVLVTETPTKAHFVSDIDTRSVELFASATGYSPSVFVHVAPGVAAPGTGGTGKFKIEQGLPIISLFKGAVVSHEDIVNLAEAAGFTGDDNWRATRSEIRQSLAELNGGDVLVFFGHGGDSDGNTSTAEGISALDRTMTKCAMVDAVKADLDPPGIVFLAGCSTHSLLGPLRDACVKLALGFTNTLPLGTAAGANKVFWSSFLGGKTLAEAVTDANAHLGGAHNPSGATLSFQGKSWIVGTMKLHEILGHPNEVAEHGPIASSADFDRSGAPVIAYTGPLLPLYASASPPSPGATVFEVAMPDEVPSGHAIPALALTAMPSRALAGVTLVLRDLEFQVIDSEVTDTNGIAVLTAPVVQSAKTLFVEASYSGGAHFVPLDDTRSVETFGATTGYYPVGFISVTPEALPASLAPPAGSKLRIHQGLGILSAASTGSITKKASSLGYSEDDNWRALRAEIREDLIDLDAADVFIFLGHGADSDGNASTAEGVAAYDNVMDEAAMVAAVSADADPPGIVFLGGCSTHSLLGPLRDACVKIALGFTDCLPMGTGFGATKMFWAKFLDGNDLMTSVNATNAYLATVLNPHGATLTYRGKPWVTGGSTLENILEHASTGVEDGGPVSATTLIAVFQRDGGEVVIRFVLGLGAHQQVNLTIHDVSGRMIRTLEGGRLGSGQHERTWDRRDDAGALVANGIYFVRLWTHSATAAKKLVLLSQ